MQYLTWKWREPGGDCLALGSLASESRQGEKGEAGKKVSAGSRAEEAGIVASDGNGAVATPTQQQQLLQPKKTISLSAYKKKITGKATPEVHESDNEVKKTTAVKGPIERLKADEEVLAAVEDGEDPLAGIEVADTEEGRKDLKRKRDVGGMEKTAHKPAGPQSREADKEGDVRTRKARRRSRSASGEGQEESELHPESESQPQTEPQMLAQMVAPTSSPSPQPTSKLSDRHPSDPAATTILPPKLSPIYPSNQPASTPLTLPPRLSPTLPANIKASLQARAAARSTPPVSELQANASRLLTPPPKAIPRNAFRTNSSSPVVREEGSEERGGGRKHSAAGAGRSNTPLKTGEDEVEAIVKTGERKRKMDTAKRRDPSGSRTRSLIVKLRIKKGRREDVRRILRMRPNPARANGESNEADGERRTKASQDTRDRSWSNGSVRGVAQKIGPSKPTPNGAGHASSPERNIKRSRPSDSEMEKDEPRFKRVKRAPLPEAAEPKKEPPSTPITNRIANLLSPSSAQRDKTTTAPLTPSTATLRKDVLSAAMKRELSNDSRLNTPGPMAQISPSPSVHQPHPQVNGSDGVTAAVTSTKTPKQVAWETEQKRLEILGRELKHAASDHLKSLPQPQLFAAADAAPPPKAQKFAAASALESFLAYILAFQSADEASLAADPRQNPSVKTWRSLHGFYGFVKRTLEPFPPLHGLACWLGVVFYARILELAGASSSSSSSAVGLGLGLGEVVETPVPSGTSRESLLEISAALTRAAADADARLDVDLLQAAFPRAWEGRFRGSLAAPSALVPGEGFEGAYKLPLGVQSSPLTAARAGFAILEEWVGGELDEGYEMRLKLSS